MSRSVQFPKADRVSRKHPMVVMPHDKITALYNRASGNDIGKVTSTVRKWFEERALEHGWNRVVFPTDIYSVGQVAVLEKKFQD